MAQMSLVHPIRFAEQMALIDNLSKGRLIVGMGRGTGYNIHEYDGYGVDIEEAQARFDEAEQVLLKAWSGEPFAHRGQFWTLNAPPVRPKSLHQAASADHSRFTHRKIDSGICARGPAVSDEYPVARRHAQAG